MIVVVWLQYEMYYSTRSSICTVSFNFISRYPFIDDVELVNLNNLEVLILRGNQYQYVKSEPQQQQQIKNGENRFNSNNKSKIKTTTNQEQKKDKVN